MEFEHLQEFDVARKLTDAGRPLKFKVKHSQRQYRLCGFTEKAIDDYFFEDSHGDGGGKKISVSAWTLRTYGITLHYGHLPGIETVSQEDVAKGKKQVVIPLELALLQGADPVQTKGDPNLTAQEIKITTGGRDGPKIEITTWEIKITTGGRDGPKIRQASSRFVKAETVPRFVKLRQDSSRPRRSQDSSGAHP